MNAQIPRAVRALIVVSILALWVAPTMAAEVPVDADASVRDAMRERRDAYQDGQRPSSATTFRERVVERRAEFASGVKDRLKNLLSNVTGRLSALARRFDNISDRMSARADILDASGVDTRAVRDALARADAEIVSAQATLDAIAESEIDAVVDDERPRERFVGLRARIVAAGGHLRSAHTHLKEAVSALRAASVAPVAPITETGTSTPSSPTP